MRRRWRIWRARLFLMAAESAADQAFELPDNHPDRFQFLVRFEKHIENAHRVMDTI